MSTHRSLAVLAALTIMTSLPGARSEPVSTAEEILPPAIPWEGRSRQLIVPPDDPWITPGERSGLKRTPRYAETVAWLENLVEAAPELELLSIGHSPEGREIWMVVASRDGFTPEALRGGGKPVLLAHAGIHAGEIDGKDAGLMLLRDMTVGQRRSALLERANFLFIPILNVDGHERFSAYGRANQRGPLETGWRTNRRNLNLNRDFTKLDTLEIRALIRTMIEWDPDLYVDLHVTDGVDYQYDITWGYNGTHGWSPQIARWLEQRFEPYVREQLASWDHIPGPLIFADNDREIAAGVHSWTASARFSNGYGDARHLPTVLVENHSLKPYEQRVLGTYVFLAASLEALGNEYHSLRRAVAADRRARPASIPLGWKVSEDIEPPRVPFKGVRSRLEHSPITGSEVVRWTGEPVAIEVALLKHDAPSALVRRPAAYFIPASWSDIAERLMLHGIRAERIERPLVVEAEMYRLPQAGIAPTESPWVPTLFEGHVRVTPGTAEVERRQLQLAPGSYRVDTDQPLGDLAVLLLEPQSPDSFFQWGFMLEVLSRTEYVEAYVMEPLARRMLREDPELAEAFRKRLAADPELAANERARLRWFYERTPYFDEEFRLYPIGRAIDTD